MNFPSSKKLETVVNLQFVFVASTWYLYQSSLTTPQKIQIYFYLLHTQRAQSIDQRSTCLCSEVSKSMLPGMTICKMCKKLSGRIISKIVHLKTLIAQYILM